MSEQEAMLLGIAENADDDVPRLVHADWLEEHGELDRADFIRLQVERASLGANHPKAKELQVRESRLFSRHRRQWQAALFTLFEGQQQWRCVFDRGFPEFLECSDAAVLLARGDEVLAAAPTLRRLHLGAATGDDLRRLSATRLWHRLVDLRLNLSGPDDDFEAGVGWPSGLKTLAFVARGRTACRLLAASHPPAGLHLLWFPPGAGVGDDGVADIARLELAGLTDLELPQNGVTDAGLAVLSQAACCARLEYLNLSKNAFTEAGVTALLQSPHLPTGVTLHLTQSYLPDGWTPRITPEAEQKLQQRFGNRAYVHGYWQPVRSLRLPFQ